MSDLTRKNMRSWSSPVGVRFARLSALREQGQMNQVNEAWFLVAVGTADVSGHLFGSVEWLAVWRAAWDPDEDAAALVSSHVDCLCGAS